MKFQVGRFTCELSRSYTGGVVVTWFRRTEPPKYLTRGERDQYHAGRAAFLERNHREAIDSPPTNVVNS